MIMLNHANPPNHKNHPSDGFYTLLAANLFYTRFNINITDMPDKKKENQPRKDENKDAPIKPEPETLHTTDPQEHMEGPISSLVKKAGESMDSDKTKEEADEEKEKGM
jgi:hypothetical protein